jgi:trimeric autotransporter adhesin
MKFKSTLFIAISLLTTTLMFGQTAANWQPVGPIQFPVNVSGQINGIGRVCQMKFHPTNPQKIYAVSASGGIWISNDGANSWNQTGTDQLPRTACASICIDHTNDSILYVGTGDPNYYSNDLGVYKSIDAGVTWFPANTTIGARMAVELIMDPLDHLSIVAFTSAGIWKTYDGGTTWIVKKSTGQFTDAAMKPAVGTRTLYGVTFGGEFTKSEDFGETWLTITNGIAVPGGGIASGMRLAISAADSTIVYAGMIKDEGTIFKSTDGGNSFTTVYHNPSQSLTGYDAGGNGQGNYNFSMCANPTNPNEVYVGAHVVWRSMDGGVTWTQLTQWWLVLHTDMHQMIFNPYNTTELYNINDGGVWRSTNSGAQWWPRSSGLGATEIYHAGSNPLRKDMISIGTQDNGELYISNGQWKTNRGGDWGSRMTYDYSNSNMVYYHENGKRRNVISGGEVSYGLPFTTSNSVRMAFTPHDPELCLAGITDVHMTLDLSSPVPFWAQSSSFNTAIRSIAFSPTTANVAYVLTSPNIFRKATDIISGVPIWTSSTLPSALNPSGTVCGVASDTNIVYVTAGSKVYRSNDQGTTWTNITLNLPNVNIINIISDPYSSDESVYICNAYSVWYKNNSLPNWINYSQGLPSVANITDFMYYDDGPSTSVLRVSYYGRGVWETPMHPISSGINSAPTPLITLEISPNPATDAISLKLPFARDENSTVQLTNSIGQIVFEMKCPSVTQEKMTIYIPQLPTGVYLIQLLDSKNNIYANGKFVKNQ